MKKIYNIVVLIFAALILSITPAFAGDFTASTTNETLTAALNKLEGINRNQTLAVLAGQNNTGKPVKVLFRNLEVYGYAKCEAVTAKTNNGGYVILINKTHEAAPLEAIACLIAHECVHIGNGCDGTFAEELRAWTTETTTWISFSQNNGSISYNDSRLVKRLNYLSRLYAQDGNNNSSIEHLIATNSAYQNLK